MSGIHLESLCCVLAAGGPKGRCARLVRTEVGGAHYGNGYFRSNELLWRHQHIKVSRFTVAEKKTTNSTSWQSGIKSVSNHLVCIKKGGSRPPYVHLSFSTTPVPVPVLVPTRVAAGWPRGLLRRLKTSSPVDGVGVVVALISGWPGGRTLASAVSRSGACLLLCFRPYLGR
jgi:hypothetical protein